MLNKKGNIAILILVLITLVLTGVALFLFNVSETGVKTEVKNARVLDDLYLRENEIVFYVNSILDKSVEEGLSEEEIVNNIETELRKYKKTGDSPVADYYVVSELGQVEEQIGKIQFQGDRLFWNLEIKLDERYEEIQVSYVFDETFMREMCVK